MFQISLVPERNNHMDGLLQFPRDAEIIRKVIGNIDFSAALDPNATPELIDKACDAAIKYQFSAVAVYAMAIPQVVERLKGTPVRSQIALGYPSGCHFTEVKLKEAELALGQGVQEIDMVMNLHRFKAGDYAYVLKDAESVVRLAAQNNVRVKLIIETGYLSDEEKVTAANIAIDAGCEFVKTCTGVFPGRGTIHDTLLLKAAVGDRIKIKTSGFIPTIEDAYGMMQAGATRSAGRFNMTDQLERIGYHL